MSSTADQQLLGGSVLIPTQLLVLRRTEKFGFHRDRIFEEAAATFMALPPEAFRKIFRFDLLAEPGLDAGGVAREVFTLVSERLVDPKLGLFLPAAGTATSATYQITPHPRPETLPAETLELYRFAGRFAGKALLDGHVIGLHWAAPVYKHLTGGAPAFGDLETLDAALFRSLCVLRDDPGMAAGLGLDFSLDYDMRPFGSSLGGSTGAAGLGDEAGWGREVTPENAAEYVELRWRRRCVGDVGPQLAALAAGMDDVLGPGLLAAWFPKGSEVEALVAGLAEIDAADWRAHTDYRGDAFKLTAGRKEPAHKVIKWFWEWVESLPQSQRQRLLVFVTGCGGVPVGGFAKLQSNDGKLARFTLLALPLDARDPLPRAHTCFNRLDLPLFGSKVELEAVLGAVVGEDLAITGFGMD